MSDVQSSLSYVAIMCATVDIDHNSCDIKYEKKIISNSKYEQILGSLSSKHLF